MAPQTFWLVLVTALPCRPTHSIPRFCPWSCSLPFRLLFTVFYSQGPHISCLLPSPDIPPPTNTQCTSCVPQRHPHCQECPGSPFPYLNCFFQNSLPWLGYVYTVSSVTACSCSSVSPLVSGRAGWASLFSCRQYPPLMVGVKKGHQINE